VRTKHLQQATTKPDEQRDPDASAARSSRRTPRGSDDSAARESPAGVRDRLHSRRRAAGLSTVVSPRHRGAVAPDGANRGVARFSGGSRVFRAPIARRAVRLDHRPGVSAWCRNPDPPRGRPAWSVEDRERDPPSSPAVRLRWPPCFWTEAYDLIEPTVDTSGARIPVFGTSPEARLAGLDLALTTTPVHQGTHRDAVVHLAVRAASPLATRRHPGASARVPGPRHLVTARRPTISAARVECRGETSAIPSRFERVELYETDPSRGGNGPEPAGERRLGDLWTPASPGRETALQLYLQPGPPGRSSLFARVRWSSRGRIRLVG